jgi:hypothetical protein
MRSIESRKAMLLVLFLAGFSLAQSLQGEGWNLRSLWHLENAQAFLNNRWRVGPPPDLSIDVRFDVKRGNLWMVEDVKIFGKRDLHQPSFDPGSASTDRGLGEPRWRKRGSLSPQSLTFGTVLTGYQRDYPWREVPARLDPPHERGASFMGDWEICAWDRPRFDRNFETKRPGPDEDSCWNDPPVSIPEPGTNMLLGISSLVVFYLVWRRWQSADPAGHIGGNPLRNQAP